MRDVSSSPSSVSWPFRPLEDLYLKRALIASVGVHFIILLGQIPTFLHWLDPIEESAIEVDLTMIGGKDIENTVARETLPQLPKKFEIDTEPKPEDAEEKDNTPEKEKIEVKKELEEQRKVTLDRWRDEMHRKMSRPADEKKVKQSLSENLEARRSQLQEARMAQIANAGTLADTGVYGGTLKAWIIRNYTIPDVYQMQHSNLEATLRLMLSTAGEITLLELDKSSGNQAFDELAINAVKGAAPFPPPPKEWVQRIILLPFKPIAKD